MTRPEDQRNRLDNLGDSSLSDEVDSAIDHILLTDEEVESLFGSGEFELDSEDVSAQLDDQSRHEVNALFEELLKHKIDAIRECISGILENHNPRRYYDTFDNLLTPMVSATGPSGIDHKPLFLIFRDFQTQLAKMREHVGKLPQVNLERLRDTYRRLLLALALATDTGDAEHLPDANIDAQLQIEFLQALRTVPQVGPRRLSKIIHAGILHPKDFLHASPDEIAAASGIPFKVAEELCARVPALYRRYVLRQYRYLVRLTEMAASIARNLEGPLALELITESETALQRMTGELENAEPTVARRISEMLG